MEFTFSLIVTVPVLMGLTIGLTEVAKPFLPDSKYATFLALVFGLLLTFAAQKGFTLEGLLLGLMVGLSSSGAYDGGRTLLNR